MTTENGMKKLDSKTPKASKMIEDDVDERNMSARKLWRIMMNNKLNLLYTILLSLNHFAYGITINIIGATLVDLRFIFGVSLDKISYIPVAI